MLKTMADKSIVDSRDDLSSDASCQPSLRDMHGSDNSMPLSPQWLQTKTGEIKMGTEYYKIPNHGEHSSSSRKPLNGAHSQELGKKKDVFKVAVHDSEIGFQDRWRDEEREKNLVIRREYSGERWQDSSVRHVGERRNPSERWSESGSRESGFDQRRGSKWNTRWGPDDKESESGKDLREKVMPRLSSHGRDTDKEGDSNSRSWRSNSFVTRGKAEPFYSQPPNTNKQTHMFGYGRGKWENGAPLSPSGRGCFNSSNVGSIASRPHHSGALPAKSGLQTGSSNLRYGRMKLLDIYRMTDVSHLVSVDEIIEVPSLTRSEPLEPLSLSAPTIEELVILKAIENEEVANSGDPQVLKEGTAGRNAVEPVLSKQTELAPWSTQSEDISCRPSADLRENSTQPSDFNWCHLSEDANNETRNATSSSCFSKDYSNCQNSQYGLVDNMSNPKFSGKERIANSKFSQDDSHHLPFKSAAGNFEPFPSPEELSLYYRDPHGMVQGPFSGIDLIGWFEAGYFGVDLEVRLASAPRDAPFLFLGDVIPQLRLKTSPPPGFCAAKHNEILETSNSCDNSGSDVLSAHSAVGGYDPSKNFKRNGVLVSTEADSQFLEPLMSTNLSSTVKSHGKGMHSHGLPGPQYSPSIIGRNDVDYLFAQEKWLNSVSISPSLSGGDSSSIATDIGIISNSPEPYSKVFSPIVDTSFQASQTSQQSDFLSLLRAGHSDKPPSVAITSGASVSSILSDSYTPNSINHTGLDLAHSKMDAHHDHLLGSKIGLLLQQQQQLQLQNLSSLSHLVNEPANLSGLVVSPEQLRSSEITQDAHLLNLLAQQYLLSQPSLHPQVSVPSQISLLNECLLLKQQLQRQQHQLLLQQQQLLLSHALSGHHAGLHLGQPSQKCSSTVPAGEVLTDQLRQDQEVQINQMMGENNLYNGHDSAIHTESSEDCKSTNMPANAGSTSLQQPHQMFDAALHSKKHENTRDVVDDVETDVLLGPRLNVTSISYASGNSVNDNAFNLNFHAKESDISMPLSSEFMSSECSVVPQQALDVSAVIDSINDLKVSSDDTRVEHRHPDVPAAKCFKNQETFPAKKSAEKKARKKKNSKSQLALDILRGFSNANQSEHQKSAPHTEDLNSHGLSEAQSDISMQPNDFVPAVEEDNSPLKPVDSLKFQSSTLITDKEESLNKKVECVDGGLSMISCLRAWKSAPGVKAKSLVEIQQEEQQKVQIGKIASEVEIIPSRGQFSAPSAGIASDSDHYSGRNTTQFGSNTECISKSDNKLSLKNKKSHLHDLLAEEVLAQSGEGDGNLSSDNHGKLFQSVLATTTIIDTSAVIDEDFIQVKDTKKGRKKESKAKVSGAKIPSPVGSFDLSFSPKAPERMKSQKQVQKDKEVLPAPSAPSLADFVSWKGELTVTSQAPAWSIEFGKLHKPASLKDIQKEQGNIFSVQQNVSVPTTAKLQSNRGNRGSGSLQVPGSSPSSGTSPIQSSTFASSRQLKPDLEDDLFWGPFDQSMKQMEHMPDFPSPGNSGAWGPQTPARASPIAISKQKSSSRRSAEHSPASSVSNLSASRGKKDDVPSIISEAMGFRDWCEKELVRLTGANDTSLLEYCLKQSTTEAETLLKQNLGSLDHNHDFIDKFLRYKDLLSSKVIETAFRANGSCPISGNRDAGSSMNMEEAWKSGKKKGKKGKVASTSMLGFNVVSNRILMGDIQTVED